MKNRINGFLGLAVLGACLCLYTQPATAQQPTPAPDQGQQGEFNGENVDTGAAALDSGSEAVEGPEAVEGAEAAEAPAALSPVTANTTVIPAAVSAATNPGSTQDLDAEGDFDLQEIAGTDIPEPN